MYGFFDLLYITNSLKIFQQHIKFTVDASESQFIHWFRNNVSKPNSFERKHFSGELSNNEFWIQPKVGYIFNSPHWSWIFKELNYAHGKYIYNDGKLNFSINIELKKNYRNTLIIGILVWLGIYAYSGFGFEVAFGGLFTLVLAIWQVRENSNFYQDLLTVELQKEK